MALTGQPGTSQSQPGMLQLGFAFTGAAVYEGPFPGRLAASTVPVGATLNVTGPVASQLAQSDLSWWVFH